MFTATTPENTSMAYRASTSANPNPVISPAFVEANYEALESLLRDWRRQMRNNDLRTELEYFSKDYDEEREMEPRPEPTRAATPPLRVASPRIHRRVEEQWGSKELRVEGKAGLKGILKGEGLQKKHPREMEVKVGQALPNNIGGNLPSNGAVLNPVGSVTPFMRWIEDYPLLDVLKMPSHISSYDGKGDPDNFQHLFEGDIQMQKWLMGPNHGLLPSLSKSPKEILATEKAARSFEPPPKMFGNYGGKESIFPPVAKVNNAPVIIEAKIFRRKVGRVYMDSGSSCEIIYDHCFEKLNPTIKATKVDLETPLVGFSGECSWSIGIPRTIMVEGKPFNTEHKLNEYNHVKPIKQNRRGLGLDHNMAACKEIEELTKAGILRKVKH
ncbi:hypothetical protein Tco_1491966 [Tanacetum coccineum]